MKKVKKNQEKKEMQLLHENMVLLVTLFNKFMCLFTQCLFDNLKLIMKKMQTTTIKQIKKILDLNWKKRIKILIRIKSPQCPSFPLMFPFLRHYISNSKKYQVNETLDITKFLAIYELLLCI